MVVMVMMMVMVTRGRGKSRSRENQHQEHSSQDLLHGLNVARLQLQKHVPDLHVSTKEMARADSVRAARGVNWR
jgi:hypothetical protein